MMNDDLPTYEHAVSREHWSFIARYLQSRDLRSAVLVCKRWHDAFGPYLWGSPASHFGLGDDAASAYVAFSRFLRAISQARLHVRELTHTVNLPPDRAEMYGGPHSEWLRDLLEKLPRLQALIVHGVPFCDHAALGNLHSPAPESSYPLRLLDASSAFNATSSGLKNALRRLPSLLYLDLSRTAAARDSTVLEALGCLPMLRVLKLRGLGLRDDEVALVAASVEKRLACLHLDNNLVTDSGIRSLVSFCSVPGRMDYDEAANSVSNLTQPFALDKQVAKILTTSRVGPLLIEDNGFTGLREISVVGNPITTDSIVDLLRITSLCRLNADVVATAVSPPAHTTATSDHPRPGFQMVIQTLKGGKASNLSYLRLNHSIVTENTVERARLRPEDMSKLHTLVLTDVPLKSSDRAITRGLIQFIQGCASSAKAAFLEARSSYSLPPGRNRVEAERQYAQDRFSLQRIVLEMSSRKEVFAISAVAPSRRREIWGGSSTEDADSDALWSAAQDDFSFFGPEEKIASPSKIGSYSSVITAKDTGKSLLQGHPRLAVDTVEEIARFRSERKAAHLEAINRVGSHAHVDGHWTGEIMVFRDSNAISEEDGQVAIYGN